MKNTMHLTSAALLTLLSLSFTVNVFADGPAGLTRGWVCNASCVSFGGDEVTGLGMVSGQSTDGIGPAYDDMEARCLNRARNDGFSLSSIHLSKAVAGSSEDSSSNSAGYYERRSLFSRSYGSYGSDSSEHSQSGGVEDATLSNSCVQTEFDPDIAPPYFYGDDGDVPLG